MRKYPYYTGRSMLTAVVVYPVQQQLTNYYLVTVLRVFLLVPTRAYVRKKIITLVISCECELHSRKNQNSK